MKKKYKIVSVQADDLSKINVKTDTTLLLCHEAQNRDYKIFWYEPKNLNILSNKLFAKGYFVKFFHGKIKFYKKSEKTKINLAESNYLLIRQNPPFNMNYYNSTLYLEKIMKNVKIINNPRAVRNISEKFYSVKFLKFMPPTIFTQDLSEISIFFNKYKKILIKPLNGYGGKGIIFINSKTKLMKISKYIKKNGYVMVQKFLSGVEKGDKRVFIINGKVYGAIRRVPLKGSILSNISQGGKAKITTINSKELKISKIVAKSLFKDKIFFAGIDFVSGKLIGDINVTSPTGLSQYKELTGINLAEDFWDNIKHLK